MLLKDFYPLFITGPFIEHKSDRKLLIYKISNHFLKPNSDVKKPIFKFFLPDWLASSPTTQSEILKEINHYCLRKSFAFESVLNEISLEKIMFPSTSSSVYELAQFNNMFSKNNVVLTPKRHRTTFNNQDYGKALQLGEYVKLNHQNEIIKYKNKLPVPSANSFPVADVKWLTRFLAEMVVKYKNKKVNFSIITLKDKNLRVSNEMIHIAHYEVAKDGKTIVIVPPNMAFLFVYEASKTINLDDYIGRLTELWEVLREKIIEIIRNKYSETIYKELCNLEEFEWKIDSSALDVYFNNKMLFLTMLLVTLRIQNDQIIEKIQIDENCYKSLVIGKRVITTYANNNNGMAKKTIDTKLSEILSTRFKHLDPGLNHAYVKNSLGMPGWIVNAIPHIKKLYPIDETDTHKKILKIDLKSFFNSMKSEIVNKIFEEHNIFDLVSNRVFSVCDDDLKQGLVLPPIISNYYLLDFDRVVLGWSSGKNIVCSRYSDDITCSFDKKSTISPEEAILFLKNELEKRFLYLNDEKTIIFDFETSQGLFKVTGIIFTKNGPKISTRLANEILKWAKQPAKYNLSSKYVKNFVESLLKSNIVIKQPILEKLKKLLEFKNI